MSIPGVLRGAGCPRWDGWREDAGPIGGWSQGRDSFPLNVIRVLVFKDYVQNLHTPSQICIGSQGIPWLG